MNKALKALKEIEWKNDLRDEQMSELCPICKRSRFMQHAQWCQLGRAIGFLEREPKCKTCGGSRKVPSPDIDTYAKWLLGVRQEDEDMGLGKVERTMEQRHQLYGMYVEHGKDNTKPCPDCAKQPTDAPTRAPEAERPFTRPDVLPEAPEDTRRAWDKMDKATEAGEFTKIVRDRTERNKTTIKYAKDYPAWAPDPALTTIANEALDQCEQACDIIDRLEKEAKTTLGTNVRLKAEYNKLEVEIERLEAQVKHTVDYCKVQVAMSTMAISAAADITGLSYKTVSEWPEIDTKDCKTFSETYTKIKRIVKEQK